MIGYQRGLTPPSLLTWKTVATTLPFVNAAGSPNPSAWRSAEFVSTTPAQPVLPQGGFGLSGGVKTEASGGVRLDTIRAIAETGVTFVSVGRLTQSAPAADIGLDFTSVA